MEFISRVSDYGFKPSEVIRVSGETLVYHPTLSGLIWVWLDRGDSPDHEYIQLLPPETYSLRDIFILS